MAEYCCPIWGEPLDTDPKDAGDSYLVYSPHAGGVYRLEGSWAKMARRGEPIAQLRQTTPRQKANLSHWIYRQNLEAGLLSPDDPTRSPRHAVMGSFPSDELTDRAPTLDHATVVEQYRRTPAAADRQLLLMRELLWQQDIRLPEDGGAQGVEYADFRGFRAASAAWTTEQEQEEFWKHFRKEEWVVSKPFWWHHQLSGRDVEMPANCSLQARLWVEKQLQARDTGQQVFVAMWFDPTLDQIYKEGFAQGIAQAGYAPYRVDQDVHHSDKLDDRVLAGIRQSRIMVADFTCEEITREGGDKPEGRPNGNVHYEAGFAHGLGLPVIYTCHRACEPYLNFDTRQINHIFWTDAADLARQLQERLEGQFGHGPVQEVPDA